MQFPEIHLFGVFITVKRTDAIKTTMKGVIHFWKFNDMSWLICWNIHTEYKLNGNGQNGQEAVYRIHILKTWKKSQPHLVFITYAVRLNVPKCGFWKKWQFEGGKLLESKRVYYNYKRSTSNPFMTSLWTADQALWPLAIWTPIDDHDRTKCRQTKTGFRNETRNSQSQSPQLDFTTCNGGCRKHLGFI